MRPPRKLAPLAGLLLAAATSAALSCGAGIPQSLPTPTLSEAQRDFYARLHLVRARALRDEGRLEAAERETGRGLEVKPNQPSLLRLQADLLEALGDPDQARLQRLRADALDPPLPPPPDVPLDLPSSEVVVVLLPPPTGKEMGERVPRAWPAGPVAATLVERLRIRLPDARTMQPDLRSVDEARDRIAKAGARSVLTLRVDRAFCGETLKDGAFAVAWLRYAAAGAAPPDGREISATSEIVRTVIDRPTSQQECREEAVARALEGVLERPDVRAVLANSRRPTEAEDPKDPQRWASRTLRTLFPELGRLVAEQISIGRRRLASGRLADAAEPFRRASEIDPEDPDVLAFLREIEISLALSSQLGFLPDPAEPARPGGDPVDLDPGLSTSQRRSIEAQLRAENRQRGELLAALAVLEDDRRAPSPEALAILRPATLGDPNATGSRLAHAHSEGPVEAKILYAPNGSTLARYYFAKGESAPILREDDEDGDGRPDRWTRYLADVRRDVWEDRRGVGRPDHHLVFAEGGDPLERLEIDADGDGKPERIFRYTGGRLRAEERDTNGNGRFDLFEKFDIHGSLTLREEDVDGDGAVDVRTTYQAGRIVRREFVNPDLDRDFQPIPTGMK